MHVRMVGRVHTGVVYIGNLGWIFDLFPTEQYHVMIWRALWQLDILSQQQSGDCCYFDDSTVNIACGKYAS